MRLVPLAAAKVICALYFTSALLVTMSLGSCTSSRWELLHTDSVSDGVAILSLAFSDANHGWAITPYQLLEISNDGKIWTERIKSQGLENAFYSLTFTNSTTGFLVGAQKKDDTYTALIVRTTDGGKSWQETPLKSAPEQDIHIPHGLHSVSFCSSAGWAVGFDLIVHTADGGKSWEVQRSAHKEENLFSVACTSPERAWAVGTDGIILQTKDAGKTWTHQDSGTKLNLARVRFFGNDGWIVGGKAGNSLLLRTRDGGATWQDEKLRTSEPLHDIYVSGTKGWIVGSGGTILHTTNGGQSWEQQKVRPIIILLLCSFLIHSKAGLEETSEHYSAFPTRTSRLLSFLLPYR